MKTAFEILGVSEQADDKAIKRAYLKKVKQYPPEKATAQFEQIRNAYDALKDARSRVKYQLFHCPETDFDKLLEQAFETENSTAIEGDSLVKLFQSTVADSAR